MATGVGSVVAGYRVERVLGSGGMGTVYLARNPELPRKDALKVLSAGLSRNPEFRARFIREADVASRLSHPNVVSIYSRGETEDGQLWIAMRFVDGTDADAALRVGTMTPARAVHIVDEIAKGLDYAHRRHVVHRDVKPGNFMLSGEPGADEHAYLGDFGIARALDEVGLTATGSLVATMAYAAPEVLAGSEIDGRADIYSLGCSLFRMLTGKTPFSGANGPAAVMMAHLHQPPPRVTDRVPGLPAALDGVIAKAMAKDPTLRHQSAGEVAAAAKEALRGASATVPWTVVPGSEVSSYPSARDEGQRAEPWWQSDGVPRTMMSPAGLPTTAPPSGRTVWTIGVPIAVVLLAGGGVAAVVAGRGADTAAPEAAPTSTIAATTPAPSPPAPLVPVSALPGLLSTVEQLEPVLGVNNLVVDTTSPLAARSEATLSDPDCASAWLPGLKAAYGGTGYQAMQLQAASDHDDERRLNQITQAVAAFLSADQAAQFFDNQAKRWQQCANRTITYTYPGRPAAQMELGASSTSPGGILSMPQRLDFGSPEQQCAHTIAVRNNVVIDVQSCSTTHGDTAPAIVGDIAARIDQPQ